MLGKVCRRWGGIYLWRIDEMFIYCKYHIEINRKFVMSDVNEMLLDGIIQKKKFHHVFQPLYVLRIQKS